MEIKPALSAISDSAAKEDVFKGFVVKEKLIEYDFPLLLVAESPEGESWLFKWCDTLGEPASAGRWIAFRVTQHRLDSIKTGHITLREAVALPENEFYVFDAKTLFEPVSIRLSSPDKLPIDYLPSDDVAIDGTMINEKIKRTAALSLRLHIFSEYITEGMPPFAIISPLQTSFQHYITQVAHVMDEGSGGRAPTTPTDWTALRLASIGIGSFKMECVSNSDSVQSEKLAKACELLAKISNGEFHSLKSIKEQIGEDGLLFASALAQCVSNLNLSMSLSWTSSNIPNGFLAFDKRRAERFLKALEVTDKELANTRNVTIILTEAEAEPILREVNGKGGMQSLLRRLQSKLNKKNRSIELTPKEIEQILKYGLNYGQGGFQDRLLGIAKALRRVSASFQAS